MAASKTMLLIQNSALFLSMLAASFTSSGAFSLQYRIQDDISRRLNNSHASEHSSPSGLASIFSPRMDFEQWKPLTGRGDPLRNDPTYDYEPPVLERVHYWADETKTEREYPEKKSEVLMLGVSSRKPSVTSRQPPLPNRRHPPQFRAPPPKYEDFTYKLSDTYPMTILVPPPPPPPGHKPSLFILDDEETPISNSHIEDIISPLVTADTTSPPEKLTSMFALQEANLIYQSSSTIQDWILDTNETLAHNINNAVSSDYAGWGPTTPIDVYESANETHNLVSNDHVEISKHPYSFYRPMLSESPPPPPPPPEKDSPLQLSTFLPTALPSTATFEQSSVSTPQVTWPTEPTTYETTTENQDYYEDTQTEKPTTLSFRPSPTPSEPSESQKSENVVNFFSMLGPMMSMPILNGPERPEDNLYAHASDNMHVYKERHPEDVLKLENMQTMQPPPPVMLTESTTASHKQPHHANPNTISSVRQNKPSLHTHDPYLHMRYTTPVSTTTSADKNKSTTEASAPMYLIIQGHSKVKTYGSKPKPSDDSKHPTNNEIQKPNETNEVKHLHPKEKFAKKLNITEVRKAKAQNLKALVDHGHGSIEIQEADLGIQYDVSDGSNVPLELYRKGIVDSDENDYKSSHKSIEKRSKRQIELEDLIPFDEDSIEEFVFNFLEGKKNETSFTGLIAQAVTSDAAAAVDELEGEDSSEANQDEDR